MAKYKTLALTLVTVFVATLSFSQEAAKTETAGSTSTGTVEQSKTDPAS